MQHDDVMRLAFVRHGRNVDLAAGHSVAHPGCLREVRRLGVLGVDEFKSGYPAHLSSICVDVLLRTRGRQPCRGRNAFTASTGHSDAVGWATRVPTAI